MKGRAPTWSRIPTRIANRPMYDKPMSIAETNALIDAASHRMLDAGDLSPREVAALQRARERLLYWKASTPKPTHGVQ